MGNVWSACCSDKETDSAEDTLPLPPALRSSVKIPLLEAGLGHERVGGRLFRVQSATLESTFQYDSLEEVEEVEECSDDVEYHDDDMDTAEENCEVLSDLDDLNSNVSPQRCNSQLRILLDTATNVMPKVSPKHVEKENSLPSSLRRVERQEHLEDALKQISSADVPVSVDLPALPHNLLIGVLDDSRPSRIFFKSYFLTTIQASTASFVRGSKLEEARCFVHEVLNKKPSAIILSRVCSYTDQRLNKRIKFYASDFAKELRQNGFMHPIIIEAKDDILSYENDQEGSHNELGECLAKVLTSKRTSREAVCPLLPPSTQSSWNSRGSFTFGENRSQVSEPA